MRGGPVRRQSDFSGDSLRPGAARSLKVGALFDRCLAGAAPEQSRERRGDFDRRPPTVCVLAQGACVGSERVAGVRRSGCHWRNRVGFPQVEWHGAIDQPEPERAFHHESHRPSPSGSNLRSVEPRARMLRPYRKLSSTWTDSGHAKLTLMEGRPIRCGTEMRCRCSPIRIDLSCCCDLKKAARTRAAYSPNAPSDIKQDCRPGV
jgi:hypothetical protein